MPWGAVTMLWEEWYPLHHCCAAMSQWKSMFHQRPNPDHSLRHTLGEVVPALLRQCQNWGNDQLLSWLARHVPTLRWQWWWLSRGLSGIGWDHQGTISYASWHKGATPSSVKLKVWDIFRNGSSESSTDSSRDIFYFQRQFQWSSEGQFQRYFPKQFPWKFQR